MILPFNEIWDFIDVLSEKEDQIKIQLIAGQACIDFSSIDEIVSIRSGKDYDPEWLPFIFTHRNILWQPNVIERKKMLLAPLRILKSDCDMLVSDMKEKNKEMPGKLYHDLFEALGKEVKATLKNSTNKQNSVSRVLSDFRNASFPLVSLFISHPCNKKEYFDDALNRLNYAVKITLTEYHGKYSELDQPHWKIIYKKKAGKE